MFSCPVKGQTFDLVFMLIITAELLYQICCQVLFSVSIKPYIITSHIYYFNVLILSLFVVLCSLFYTFRTSLGGQSYSFPHSKGVIHLSTHQRAPFQGGDFAYLQGLGVCLYKGGHRPLGKRKQQVSWETSPPKLRKLKTKTTQS